MALTPFAFRHCQLDWSRVYIAGVVNVTPDSFSDGGLHEDVQAAVAHGRALVASGADLLDIGGESTRPGATPVDAAREIERVLPVIATLARAVDVPLSIDTTKAEVARAALGAGAEIVNDISGGRFDPDIIEVTRAAGAVYICGHVRGSDLAAVHAPRSPGQASSRDEAPIDPTTVAFELAERVTGLPVELRHRTIVDPCLGFGKYGAENLALARFAGELGRAVGCPVLVGPSRKRFVRAVCESASGRGVATGMATKDVLDAGTVGACLAAAAGGANILRVHNVELLRPALMVYEAIVGISP